MLIHIPITDLLHHETELLRSSLQGTADLITERIITDILSIQNPNETIYELMKMCYLILTENIHSPNPHSEYLVTWRFLQENIRIGLMRSYMMNENLISISKNLLDSAMPFSLNYVDIKNILLKISKNLVLVLDFIKTNVEFSIKNNLKTNLFTSNINKNEKVKTLQNDFQQLEMILREAGDCYNTMQDELNGLVGSQKHDVILGVNLIQKYQIIERYRVFIQPENRLRKEKAKFLIKLKGKYKNRNSFLSSILSYKLKSSEIKENENEDNNSNNNNKNNIKFPTNQNLNFPRKLSDNNSFLLENHNTNSLKSRNIYHNIYTSHNAKFGSQIPATECPQVQSRPYYTCENMNMDMQKTFGSTIYRDVDSIENIIREDKKCDVVPLNAAIKPSPKCANANANANADTSLSKEDRDRDRERDNTTNGLIFTLKEKEIIDRLKPLPLKSIEEESESLKMKISHEGNLSLLLIDKEKEFKEKERIKEDPVKENQVFAQEKKVSRNSLLAMRGKDSTTNTGNVLRIEANKIEQAKYFCCQ